MKRQYFELGQKVCITAILEKQQIFNGDFYRTDTTFITNPCPPTRAYYIGYRSAQTGYTKYDEDGPEFRPTGRQHYYLVVTNPRQNPIKVPMDACS